MRSNEVYRAQLVLVDVFLDGEFLCLGVCTTVDDDALLGLVANNIAVLLQHVACECFYLEHFFFSFCRSLYGGV